ncbi:hypothetical protein BTJ44_04790 [Bacillus mycoides]|nr:hypothetical protein BTJ44_04790 [Bacillus mycoides]
MLYSRDADTWCIYIIELIIAKNRNGFIGTLSFEFVKKIIH